MKIYKKIIYIIIIMLSFLNIGNAKYDKIFFMSALNKNEVNSFRKDVYKEIRKIHITRFPYNAFLYPDIA